jgi:hypothetical protein
MTEKLNPKYAPLLGAVCPKAFRQDATREDAGETLVIQRALDHIETNVTEVMYAELRALRFIPTIPGIDPGKRSYTFFVQDKVGDAGEGGGTGRDLPRVDAFLTENTSGMKTIGAEYAFTTEELRELAAAAKLGLNINLETLRSKLVAEFLARKIDSLLAFGDPNDSRIKGFLNNANVTVDSASAAWSTLTPEELLAELYALADTQLIVSKEVFSPDVILLPTSHHRLVYNTQFGISGNTTVLGFFLRALADAGRKMSVESWPRLALADAGRTGPRAVSYVRDVEIAGAIVPLPFAAQPPQPRGLEWVVPCEAVCGGVAVKQPLGMYYRDGLDG